MEEFGRTDDQSKEALEAVAKKMTESVRDLMKGGTGPNKSRTGIDRLLGRSRNKVHYSLFHWILGLDFALKKYQVYFDTTVHPPPLPEPPKRPRPGAPRKSFEDKGRTGQFNEAREIKENESSHDFQAIIKAAALAAKEKGLGDLGYILDRLAKDPVDLPKQLKEFMTSTRQGTSIFQNHNQAVFLHCLSSFVYLQK